MVYPGCLPPFLYVSLLNAEVALGMGSDGHQSDFSEDWVRVYMDFRNRGL